MSINFNPGPKFLALIDQDQWVSFSAFNDWTQAVTGSGATTRSARKVKAQTGTTASSTALIRTTNQLGWSLGKTTDIINWSKKVVLHTIVKNSSVTANGVSRLTMGKLTSTGIGALADKGIGLSIVNDALKGIVHDGASETTVDLSTTISDSIARAVTIVSDGAGNVEWFLDGVSKGSTAAGPTGDSSGSADIIQIEADNGGDTAGQIIIVNDLKIFVEQ